MFKVTGNKLFIKWLFAWLLQATNSKTKFELAQDFI